MGIFGQEHVGDIPDIIATRNKCKCFALSTAPETKKLWEKIFPGGRVPIKGPLPAGLGELANTGIHEYYLVDFTRVTFKQKEMLIHEMGIKFHLPEIEVWKDMNTLGCPIKNTELIIQWCKLHSRMVT